MSRTMRLSTGAGQKLAGFCVAPHLMCSWTVNTKSDDRLERVYRFLVVVHMATVLVALIVGIAVAHHGQQPRHRENESTFERQAPQIENWPAHHRPLQRG